ncbi:UDP-arabinose 4-epimerase [Salvia divinorum]|uniref:UDP-arabinose 4-epimerase n=1 Tax=Salvia divinorum TaxID=28513 RepID=A0ABD1GAK5_SALDI
MGFRGILISGKPKDLDHHLITAVIELWCLETHTFHFPICETIITLEVVQFIWGLKLNGDPVTGYILSQSSSDWARLCVDLLGVQPDAAELNGFVLEVCDTIRTFKIETKRS